MIAFVRLLRWKSNMQHCKSDDFRARFEVAKWRVFCIQRCYKLALPDSTKFNLTEPDIELFYFYSPPAKSSSTDPE